MQNDNITAIYAMNGMFRVHIISRGFDHSNKQKSVIQWVSAFYWCLIFNPMRPDCSWPPETQNMK